MSEDTLERQSAIETISLFLAILVSVLIQGYLPTYAVLSIYLNLVLAVLVVAPLAALRILKKKERMLRVGTKALSGLHWYARVLSGVLFRSGIFLVLLFSIEGVIFGLILTPLYLFGVYRVILLSRTVRHDWQTKADQSSGNKESMPKK